MFRSKQGVNKRFLLIVLIVILLLTAACNLLDIGGAVGNLGEALENMFKNIGKGFGL